MKKLFSARYSAGAFNAAMFILRVGFGVLICKHGYDKMQAFDTIKPQFISFMGLSQSVSLSLDIFAELFCGALVVLGFATRLACVPLIITMAVALAKAHNYDVWKDGQAATLFLIAFLAILFAGPGKASIDGIISK